MAPQQGTTMVASKSFVTVTDILQEPRPQRQAALLSSTRTTGLEVAPFSLLPRKRAVSSARTLAAELCGLETEQIEDLFPCTPWQAGIMASTMLNPSGYTGQLHYKLNPEVNTQRFLQAWRDTVTKLQILRTRIVDLNEIGLMQAVTTGQECRLFTTFEDHRASDKSLQIQFGLPLGTAVLIDLGDNKEKHLLLDMHRAIYDDWTLPIITSTLEETYTGQHKARVSYQCFVKYCQKIDKQSAIQFWQHTLEGSEAAVHFPMLPKPSYQPCATMLTEHRFTELEISHTSYTMATFIRTALAIVLSRCTNSSNTIFGAVVSGRQAPVDGIADIAGPTLATIPVYTHVNPDMTVDTLLQTVQTQIIDAVPFEQFGLQHIGKINEENRRACSFQTLLIVQPPAESHNRSLFSGYPDANRSAEESAGGGSSYGMVIECVQEHRGLTVRIASDPNLMDAGFCLRMAQRLEHVIRQIAASVQAEKPLTAVNMMSEQDVADLWLLNARVPAMASGCVHDIIARTIKANPESIAINAWDGDFTYNELDIQSTRLARLLIDLGTVPGDIIPLCFEKSMWTPVAMLSIMKSGATWVALDKNQPEERLRAILTQINPRIIMSSRANKALTEKLDKDTHVVVVSAEEIAKFKEDPEKALPSFKPNTKLYITFTSGTTGKPKGVVVTHSNFSSALIYQDELFKLKPDSRVFDFAPYAFDTSWATILFALQAGACICTPSEEESQDPESAMRRFGVTYAGMTPTIARMLRPEKLPDLKTLILGGETIQPIDCERWAGRVFMMNCYGPSECTPTATMYHIPGTLMSNPPIGRPYGLCAWVVDINTDDKLMGIDEIGELWLEGPLVGGGYLGDPERTQAAFVDSPVWLTGRSPPSGQQGRRGRLYRTGDLVRLRADGNLDFVGRRDNQTKIRGQRVELSEVEYHVQTLVDKRGEAHVVAEIITTVDKKTVLVAFIVPSDTDQKLYGLLEAAARLTDGLDEELAALIPLYMVPCDFYAIAALPETITKKTDRKRLRELGATLHAQRKLSTNGKQGREPTTASERLLCEIWASLLEMPASQIRANDSFIRLGGDSISAMRLSKAVRARGFAVTAAQVLQHPRLSELAPLLLEASGTENVETKPLSMLKRTTNPDTIRSQAASLCNVSSESISDVFPCTPLQEGLLAMTQQRPGDYVATFVLELKDTTSIEQVQRAFESVVKSSTILQTRIVDVADQGLVQVVVDEPLPWITGETMEEVLARQLEVKMSLETQLCYLGICKNINGKQTVVLTLHHALYDGWSIALLVNAVRQVYEHGAHDKLVPMQRFVHYLTGVDNAKSDALWKAQFSGSTAVSFPTLPSTSYQPKAKTSESLQVEDITWTTGHTASTIVRGALALVQAWNTQALEAVFGVTVMGRNAPVIDIERISGPTIATVPVRVKLQSKMTLAQYIDQVHAQSVEMIAYEQTGLARIRQVNADARRCCEFQTLLVVQPQDSEFTRAEGDLWIDSERSTNTGIDADRHNAFNTYAAMIVCYLEKDGVKLDLNYDSDVLTQSQASQLLASVELVLHQMTSESSTKTIQDVNILLQQQTSVHCPTEQARKLWHENFRDLEGQAFPRLPSSLHHINATSWTQHYIQQVNLFPVNVASTLRASLAVWLARHTDSSDVIFGSTEESTDGILNTYPVRVTLHDGETVDQLIDRVETQRVKMQPFAQVGRKWLRNICDSLRKACGFQILLDISEFEQSLNERHHKLGSDEPCAVTLYCTSQSNGLAIQAAFDPLVADAHFIDRMLGQFEHILRQICSSKNGQPLSEIGTASRVDLDQIWIWNKEVPETSQRTIHGLFLEKVQSQPSAPAVHAWDGDWSYAELDEISTRLAKHLIELDIGQAIVPICFEKSRWTPVAVLGVMKAGGASVLLDTTLPKGRLRSIVEQATSSIILASASKAALAKVLAGNRKAIIVPRSYLSSSRGIHDLPSLPLVRASDMLYAVFTSGTTGTPKGAIISHSNFCSAVQHQQSILGIVASSRVFDFASYAFDVSWSNLLHTLTAGACICIPSEDDRRDDITGSIARLGADYAALTPSVARLIDQSRVPTLETLRFGGERLFKDDVDRWESIKTLLNGYGPAECTVSSTISLKSRDSNNDPSIGRGFGVNTWVVDRHNGRYLVPLGAIGELWLEGPLVGLGYLRDDAKTAAAFIEDPPWLFKGAERHPGRKGRLYKTGDLVRYNEDGTIKFIGRKDGQIKIRGQRVELRDIEHHIQEQLCYASPGAARVVVELISSSGGQTSLVAFVNPTNSAAMSEGELMEAVNTLTKGVQDRLSEVVPAYMIPSIYVPLAEVPIGPAGKTGRQHLRKLGNEVVLKKQETSATVKSQDRQARLTDMEKQLQTLWATVLNIDPNNIRNDDNFFEIGGNSIQVMRLVNGSRRNGCRVSATEIMKRPVLTQLASYLENKMKRPRDLSSEKQLDSTGAR